MSNEYFDFIDSKRQIQSKVKLPPDFWRAFEDGLYPSSITERISYHIEEFAKLIEGIGYGHSSYYDEYETKRERVIFFIPI